MVTIHPAEAVVWIEDDAFLLDRSLHCGEIRLLLAVVKEAVKDFVNPHNDTEFKSAEDFLFHQAESFFPSICDLIGIDVEVVRELLIRKAILRRASRKAKCA